MSLVSNINRVQVRTVDREACLRAGDVTVYSIKHGRNYLVRKNEANAKVH